jgi:hypothetical protein
VTITSLNENIEKKWTYFVQYWWHPLMVDNEVVVTIVFVTIHKWLYYIFDIAIQNVQVNLLVSKQVKKDFCYLIGRIG